jgi:hypothetical protein
MNNKSSSNVLPFYRTVGDNSSTNAVEMSTFTEPNDNSSENDSGVAAITQSNRNDNYNKANTWIALASLGVAIMQFVQGFYF